MTPAHAAVPTHPALLDHWYAVSRPGDVAPGPLPVTVLGRRFVLWRAAAPGVGTAGGADDDTSRSTEPSGGGSGGRRGDVPTETGTIVAAPDRCPHREAPLSLGRIEDGCLVCAYHGWTFGGDGHCVRVPSSAPDVPIGGAAHLRTVPVVERYGLVWLCPGEPGGDPPLVSQDDDPRFRRLDGDVEVWQAAATRMADNFCDVAHFPYVHSTTLGAGVSERVAPIHVEALDDGYIGYRYAVDVDDAAGRRITQEMTTGFHLPFTVRSTTRVVGGPGAGNERILLLCTTPIDDVSSLFSFVVWRRGDDGPSDEEQLAFDRAVGAEDRAMLERIPGSLPLDVTATANVRSDRLSVEWRRRLAALVAG